MSGKYEPLLNGLIDKIVGSGLAQYDHFRGCSKAQVLEIEQDQEVPLLPASYQSFLETMGRHAGGVFDGTSILYPEVLGAKHGARALLARRQSPLELGDSKFVFMIHQGYVFAFFDVLCGEDPEVVQYMDEEDPKFERISSSFTEYLEKWVKDYLNPRFAQ
jgi:hypothetical protein